MEGGINFSPCLSFGKHPETSKQLSAISLSKIPPSPNLAHPSQVMTAETLIVQVCWRLCRGKGEEVKFSLPNAVHCDENEVKKEFLSQERCSFK
jgi:hypothetical protein